MLLVAHYLHYVDRSASIVFCLVVRNICMHASNYLIYPSMVWVHINMFHTIIISSLYYLVHACLSCSLGASNSAGSCERCDGCTNHTMRLTQDLLQQHKITLPAVLLHSPQEVANLLHRR
jgi:hypothetical protein